VKNRIYLIGAGDFGREIESWLELLKYFKDTWHIAGFLDDNINALDDYPSDYKVLGTPGSFTFDDGDQVILCIANPEQKKRMVKTLAHKVKFFTYIHDDCILGKFTEIGTGVIIVPRCVISTNVKIGDFVTINCGSQIGHDCQIGSFSSIMANVDIGGHCDIGDSVFIGSNSTIIPHRSITDNVVIGAGSIVLKKIRKSGTYFGNPAKYVDSIL
jgi:sugar O-acyltransferase (sialic acid O-acetyltransferase NeuD family)